MKLKLSKPVRQAIVNGAVTNRNSCRLVARPFENPGLYKVEVSTPKMNLLIDLDLRGLEATLLYTQASFTNSAGNTDFSEAELDALDPDCSLIRTINTALH